MKTRRNRVRRKKGGTTYSIGRTKDYKYYYTKDNIPTIPTTFSDTQKHPRVFADVLKNVSIHRNADKNYKYYGFLMMEVKRPIDFETVKWALEKYLTENVLTDPKLSETNKMGITLNMDHIRIFDFRFNHNDATDNNDVLQTAITITGSIYIYDIEKLGSKVEKKLLSNLPPDVVNREIKEYL